MRVFCVQLIANAQERLQNSSINLGGKEREVHRYKSFIRTHQQTIGRIDVDIKVQMSALQGEHEYQGRFIK